MRTLITILLVSLLIYSCNNKAEEKNVHEVTQEQQQNDSLHYLGESFDIAQVVSVNELPNLVGPEDSAIVVARGKVMEVCQAKGCWMTLAVSDDQSMRVTFKDYGFFMPKDLAGKEVIMKGKASYTTTDVATLKHLAEDAGKSQEEIAQITDPEVALNFEATGVTIL